jgi:hypothetical protein
MVFTAQVLGAKAEWLGQVTARIVYSAFSVPTELDEICSRILMFLAKCAGFSGAHCSDVHLT